MYRQQTETRANTGFAAIPRARARKQKKQESKNRARKPARGTLRVPPASRLPLQLSSPRKRGRQVPRKPSQLNPRRQEKAAPILNRRKKRSSEKESGQPSALRIGDSGFCAVAGGHQRAAGTFPGVRSTDFLPNKKKRLIGPLSRPRFAVPPAPTFQGSEEPETIVPPFFRRRGSGLVPRRPVGEKRQVSAARRGDLAGHRPAREHHAPG